MKTQLEAIRVIDHKAAEYIENEVLPKRDLKDINYFIATGFDILDLFIWALTPQGRDYWFDIWGQLNGVKNESSENLGEIDDHK